jgi:hypothetical protein
MHVCITSYRISVYAVSTAVEQSAERGDVQIHSVHNVDHSCRLDHLAYSGVATTADKLIDRCSPYIIR